MEWMQILTIVGVNIALIGAVITVVIWMVNKIHSNVKIICTRQNEPAMKTDELYQSFIELLKEGRK